MAVGLTQPDSLLPIRGIRLAAGACGIKANQQSDLVLIVADEGTQSAAVFTKNAYCAAPVKIARAVCKGCLRAWFLQSPGVTFFNRSY